MAQPCSRGQIQMIDPERLLKDAETVVVILKQHQVEAVVIGATALAAYNYVRQTEDIDLGVNADMPTLHAVVEALKETGFHAEFREPDADDPLGGVIDITSSAGLLQVISYSGRFPAVIDDAVRDAELVVRPGSPLHIVPVPQLIALKLYAGGRKSEADIVELLIRNPDIDVDEVRKVCRRYRLRGLDALIAEASE